MMAPEKQSDGQAAHRGKLDTSVRREQSVKPVKIASCCPTQRLDQIMQTVCTAVSKVSGWWMRKNPWD
jgi:hypothetical protein